MLGSQKGSSSGRGLTDRYTLRYYQQFRARGCSHDLHGHSSRGRSWFLFLHKKKKDCVPRYSVVADFRFHCFVAFSVLYISGILSRQQSCAYLDYWFWRCRPSMMLIVVVETSNETFGPSWRLLSRSCADDEVGGRTSVDRALTLCRYSFHPHSLGVISGLFFSAFC